jgi:hypothetical protein
MQHLIFVRIQSESDFKGQMGVAGCRTACRCERRNAEMARTNETSGFDT